MAWLLNLINTSLFVSIAIQYYTMIRDRHALEAFLSFLPVILIEALILYFLLPQKSWLFVLLILASNLFFQAFRGELLSKGRFIFAALSNFIEQCFKIGFLMFLVFILKISIENALLISILMAYLLTFLFSLTYWLITMRSFHFHIHVKETFGYAAFYAGVYLITSIDLLGIQNNKIDLNVFALVKPWGIIIFTLSVPMINVLIGKLKSNKPVKSFIHGAILLYVFYLVSVLLCAEWLNPLFFHHSLPSHSILLLVIVEHIAISVLIAIFHRNLQKQFTLGPMIFMMFGISILIASLAQVLSGSILFSSYALVFFAVSLYATYRYIAGESK